MAELAKLFDEYMRPREPCGGTTPSRPAYEQRPRPSSTAPDLPSLRPPEEGHRSGSLLVRKGGNAGRPERLARRSSALPPA